MRILRKTFFFALLMIAAALLCINVMASEDEFYLESNIYNNTVVESYDDFNMSVLSPTSDFRWRNKFGGELDDMRTEQGLGAYVLSSNYNTGFTSTRMTGLDAYHAESLSFAVSAETSVDWTMNVILTLTSNEHTLVCRGIAETNRKNIISFDIGFWKYRSEITKISLSYECREPRFPLVNAKMSGPYIKKENPDMEGFMSYGLSSEGNIIERENAGKADESLRIELMPKRITVSGKAYVPYLSEECRTLRITMSNNSPLSSVQLSYTYFDGITGGYSVDTRNITLEEGEDRVSYLVDIKEVSLINGFSLIFDSVGTGEIRIHSIEPVLIYEGYREESFGEITGCRTESDGRTLNVSGSVKHGFLISHSDSVLLCYRLMSGESFSEAILRGAKPVAKAKMSSKFSFELKLSRLGDGALLDEYAVAAEGNDGELILLTSPHGVELSTASASDKPDKSNIKGLVYNSVTESADLGIGVSVIEVYLDRLMGARQSGHIYTVGGKFIYFDAEYVAELDKNVGKLSAEEARVYLRLLISPTADRALIPFAAAISDGAAPNFLSVDISSEEGKNCFYGALDFLSARYSGNKNGIISGYILGHSTDLYDSMNYSPEKGLRKYAENVAYTLEFTARAASASIPNIEVLLPISDKEEGELDRELLLTSVSRYLSEGGGTNYSVFFEASLDSMSPKDRISDFEKMLKRISSYSKSAPEKYMYCLSFAYSEDLFAPAEYICNYYGVLFSDMANGFVLSLSEDTAGRELLNELSYLIKYIDTDINRELILSRPALDYFDAESIEALFENFDADKLKYRKYAECETEDKLPDTIKGSYDIIDFSSSLDTGSWLCGSGCSKLYIDTSFGKRTLGAVLGHGEVGEYSEIIYPLAYDEDISVMPYITFFMEIDDGGAEDKYELQVILGGEGNRIEAEKKVNGGENIDFIIRTADTEALKKAEYVKIRVRKQNGEGSFTLKLDKVTAHSTALSSSALEAEILDMRSAFKENENTSEAVSEVNEDIIIAVVLLIIPAVAIVGFYDRRQK